MPLCNNLSTPKRSAPFKGVLLCCEVSVYHTPVRYLNHGTGSIYTEECQCQVCLQWGWHLVEPLPGNSRFGEQGVVLSMQICPKVPSGLLGLWKQDRQMKQLAHYKAHCQGEVGFFFPWCGFKNVFFSVQKMHLTSQGQALCERRESERSGMLWQMLCVSAHLCAHHLLC